jgi:hypothetical protein
LAKECEKGHDTSCIGRARIRPGPAIILLDKDIFELFLRSGIYREYGKKNLRPDQVDEVDIDLLLA